MIKQKTMTVLTAATLAAVVMGCDSVTGTQGTVRFVASQTVTGEEIAADANRPLPYAIEPGGAFTFEGPFDDPPDDIEPLIERLQSAAVRFKFESSLDLEAVVDAIMSSGRHRCVLARNMHARDRGTAPVTWSSLCTDIFFSPDRVVELRVTSTGDQEVMVGPDDFVVVSVRAVFNLK
jgi:hypothetical protein